MQLTPVFGLAPTKLTLNTPSDIGLSVNPADITRPMGAVDPISPGARPGRQDELDLDGAVNEVLAADSKARISVDRNTNTATFVSGEFGVVVKPGVGGSGPDRIARTFLVKHGALFGINDQNSSLKLLGIDQDKLGFKHFKYQQMHQGLPVFGQQLIVHAKDENVTSVGGRTTPNIPNLTPKIESADAAAIAMKSTRTALVADKNLGGGSLKAIGNQELGWFTTVDGTPRLAYEVIVGAQEDQRWQLYVDATNGSVLDKWSLVHSALSRETVDSKSGKVRREGDGPSGDEVLDIAHDNAKGVYDFFKSKFDRDSIDGKGMKLKSIVHYGNKYNNAFWNGSHMTYGDGDGVMFAPLVSSDVVAHEMTHGVTERTAGLRYRNQSGALNESWSDVFGNLVEKWMEREAGEAESDPTWLIGEQIFTPGVSGDGLRSMSKPGTGYAKDPQPGHMRDYKNTSSDNGGVHINSGIPNKAAYEVAMSIGQDKLADIWYRALSSYMTSTSEFSDAANFTVQSAIDLYGKGSSEARSVADAWSSVGLTPSLQPGINPRA